MALNSTELAGEDGGTPKKRRRPKGEGGVRQVVFEPGKERWESSIDVPSPDGKRHRRTFRGKTAFEALKKKRAFVKALEDGKAEQKPIIWTVGDWMDDWLEKDIETAVDAGSMKATTGQNYRHVVSAYIRDYIGSRRLTALKTDDVNAWTARMGRAELSQNTIRLARSVLRMGLEKAVDDELISRNPVKRSRPAKVAHSTKPNAALDFDQAKRLLGSLDDEPLGPLVATALLTALRKGELLALRWADVDLDDKRRIDVHGTASRITGKGIVVTAPKTTGSEDWIPIVPEVIEIFRKQAKLQAAQREKAGPGWTESGLVFTDPDGDHIDPARVSRVWNGIRDARKLPSDATFHDLRHSTATLLIDAGAPIEVVSRILRHSSITITADIYVKLKDANLRKAMESLHLALLGVAEADETEEDEVQAADADEAAAPEAED